MTHTITHVLLREDYKSQEDLYLSYGKESKDNNTVTDYRFDINRTLQG